MKQFQVSKSIRQGTVCAFRGSKLIRASKRSKHIAGVWTAGAVRKIYTPDGVQHIITDPPGLQTYGPANVSMHMR